MKIAVMADIHNNFAALEACLTYCEKNHIHNIAFLGDYVSDCPSPQLTMALLKQAQTAFHTVFIRGNREEYMLNQKDHPNPDWKYGSAWGSLYHTFNRLTYEDLAWFRGLPIYRNTTFRSGEAFEMCHGTPRVARKIVYEGSAEMKEVLGDMTTELMLCGHSHIQFHRKENGKHVVNCGSVGIACDDDPSARMAVVERTLEDWQVKLLKLPYDVDRMEQEFLQSGFMEEAKIWAKIMLHTVKTGHEYSWECINIVNRICKETGRSRNEEGVWEEAAHQVGLL